MKVETEQLPNSEVALSFEVEDARFQRAIDAAAKRLAQRVNIPGFRRGKAPRALIERTVGKETVIEEALDHLLPEVYREVLGESGIEALTEPEFAVESVAPLLAKATVVVPPPVTLGDYRSIQHAPPDSSVTPEQVDANLQELRERHADWVPVDRAAQLDDVVIIDVSGECEERPILNQQGIDYLLVAGRPAPVPGFVEAVVGSNPGETRSFDLSAPEDHDDKRVAGKAVAFTVEVKEVRAKELPELDDYFAGTLGEYESLAQLRTSVEDQLREQAEARANQTVEEEVIESAVSSAEITLPEKLITHEIERARDRLARNLDSYGMTAEQYGRLVGKTAEETEQSLRTQAEKDLRRELVLRAIAAQEGLAVLDEEVDERIQAALEADKSDPREVTRLLKESSVRQRVRGSLLEEHAAAWLVKQATAEAPSQGESEP